MPVRLTELRTLIADTVRVQRLQELQQNAVRAHQETLASQFRDVLQVRRATVKETDATAGKRIEGDEESGAEAWENENERESEGDESEAAEGPPEPAEDPDGVGGIIDLRG